MAAGERLLFVEGTLAGSFKISIDKAVDITVHNSVYIAGFKAGSVILNHSVGHKYIGADLAAPSDYVLNALDVFYLIKVLLGLDLNQLGTKHLHTVVAVLELASFSLAGNNDTGGNVGESYSTGGFCRCIC